MTWLATKNTISNWGLTAQIIWTERYQFNFLLSSFFIDDGGRITVQLILRLTGLDQRRKYVVICMNLNNESNKRPTVPTAILPGVKKNSQIGWREFDQSGTDQIFLDFLHRTFNVDGISGTRTETSDPSRSFRFRLAPSQHQMQRKRKVRRARDKS